MKFVLFVVDDSSGSGSASELASIDEFNDQLHRDGNWVLAAGIGSPATATLVDNRNGAGRSKAGSLNDGAVFYSGLWIIDADSPKRAHELASAASRACNRRVEVRPFLAP